MLDILRELDKGERTLVPEDIVVKIYTGVGFKDIRKQNEDYGLKSKQCANCGYKKVLDGHHIYITHHDKPPMTNGKPYQYCFGIIWLCPNCHCILHRLENGG